MSSILEQIESQYPVDTVLVNGEQAWPYLRFRYYSAYVAMILGSKGEASADPQALRGGRVSRRLRFMKRTLFDMAYGFRNWFRKYDYILFTDTECRRRVGDRYVNRFLDPIVDELRPSRVLCIENTLSTRAYPRSQVYTRYIVSESLLILASLVIALLRRVFLRRYRTMGKEVLDKIESDLGITPADSGLTTSASMLIEYFEARRKVSSWLFRVMRPRAIMLSCYVGGEEPVVRAARSLGIKVVEVQHGVIGKKHPGYNVYRDMDRSCFPEHLLVFGERELATFDNPRFIDRANVHPVGSYYIDYMRANHVPEPQISARLEGYRTVVGVTLQWTSEKRLIGFICEAARLDNSILYILIPRHPEDPSYSAMEVPRNVVVIGGKNFHELMPYCRFHSTVSSTCALEAPALGVQNILVDLDGSARAYYGEVLSDERLTRFASTPAEYVALVKSFAKLERDVVCELHKGFFATNYQENIRSFVKSYL